MSNNDPGITGAVPQPQPQEYAPMGQLNLSSSVGGNGELERGGGWSIPAIAMGLVAVAIMIGILLVVLRWVYHAPPALIQW